ncbi:MAG: 50S ribosomal protein L9 [Syntrophales bacterium]
MEVILKQNIEALGKMGDVIKVSDGYARNYLIPRDLAVPASSKNIRALEHEKQVIAKRAEKEKKNAESMLEKFANITCTIYRKIGEQNKLFGSVSAKDIEKAMQEMGVEISRKNIILDEPIKSIGEFPVRVKLYPGITASLVVRVAEEQ